MINFIKSIITGENESAEEKQEKEIKKNFDILKYDGIRAMQLDNLNYAEKCLTEAIAIQKETETMEYLARLYNITEQPDKAIAVLEELENMHPESADYLLYMANIYYEQQKYNKMAEICQAALSIDNKNVTALYQNARAHHKLNDEFNAIALLTQALDIEPVHPEALLLRASILLEMQQFTEAEKDVHTFLENTDADKQEAWMLKGKIRIGLHDIDNATQCFSQLIEENPFNKEAYLILADTLLKAGNVNSAINIYDEALGVMPDFAEAYYERGRAKLQKGDSEASLNDIKKAIEINPEIEKTISGQFNNEK